MLLRRQGSRQRRRLATRISMSPGLKWRWMDAKRWNLVSSPSSHHPRNDLGRHQTGDLSAIIFLYITNENTVLVFCAFLSPEHTASSVPSQNRDFGRRIRILRVQLHTDSSRLPANSLFSFTKKQIKVSEFWERKFSKIHHYIKRWYKRKCSFCVSLQVLKISRDLFCDSHSPARR